MSIDLKDLPKVIKACKASGVSELKVGDVHIKFAAFENAQAESLSVDTVAVPTPDELKDAEAAALVQRNVEAVEDELAHMHIEDPLGFEQRLIERELEQSGATHNQ